MANYLSHEYKITNPPQLGDLRILDNVMTTLQGKYDANKSLIDQTLAQYNANLKGRRDVDNEYIAQKLKTVKANVDQLKKTNGNLAYNYNKDSILSAITSTLEDPIVQGAILDMQKYRAYEKEAKKDPKAYAEQNFNYGLYKAGNDDYMSGKTKSMGKLVYTPYIDLKEAELKELKAIKDLKGKRFVEFTSHDGINRDGDGTGRIKVKKEIDGLTEGEIRNYIEGGLSPQERMQMQINGHSKYGAKEVRDQAVKVYSDYHNQNLKNLQKNHSELETRANNALLDPSERRQWKAQAEQTKYEIDNLSKVDPTKVDIDTISYELEKKGYINNLATIASAEWSTSTSKNDVYYADADLDIKRQNLKINEAKFNLDVMKFQKEQGVDANGNPVLDGVMAESTRQTTTPDIEGGAGARGLRTTHDNASNEMLASTQEFLKVASDDDKATFKKLLKEQGIDENLQFTDPEKRRTKSELNTIISVFEAGGFPQKYVNIADKMNQAYAVKQTAAKDILKVESEGYLKAFNKDAQGYVNNLIKSRNDLSTYSVPSVTVGGRLSAYSDKEKQAAVLAKEITNFITKAGGEKNLKSYLENNPGEVRTFADLSDKVDKAYKGINQVVRLLPGTPTKSSFSDKNLKEDAKKDIEETIQTRTQSGLMTSFYKDFTITDKKVKANLLATIPNERTTFRGGTAPALLDRGENSNTSFYRDGKNIVIVQEVKGKKGGAIPTETIINPGDAAYKEIEKHLDFNVNKSNIQVTQDTKLPPVKVKIRSFERDDDSEVASIRSIKTVMQNNPNIYNAFGSDRAALGYATKEVAQRTIEAELVDAKIPQEKRDMFSQAILGKINTYTVTPKGSWGVNTQPSLSLQIDGMAVNKTINLKTNVLDKDLNYLIKYYPHIFIISDAVRRIKAGENIDKITQDL